MANPTTDNTDGGPTHNDKRNQGLDLLRALAILGVIVMHVANHETGARGESPPALTGVLGYLGVELFFILSGFLIGRILIGIAAARPGPRDWGIFLVRRWMRTLPLYFLWLAILLLFDPPFDRAHMALLYATFTQNFAWPTPQEWFSVSWSLAIEEWFYLLFSTVLLGLAALRVRAWLSVSCILFLALPLAARIFLAPADAPFDTGLRQVAIYRLDAITYGVLMAWAYTRNPALLTRWKKALFLLGCFLLLAPDDVLLLAGNPGLFKAWAPFRLSLTSIAFAMWIPAALDIRISAPRIAGLVNWLSQRSYCLYIIHLTILDLVWHEVSRQHLPLLLCAPLALAASAGLAELSFRFFETPLLGLRPRQIRDRPAVAGAAPTEIAIPAGRPAR